MPVGTQWDWILSILIIVGLILAIWAKISQQTIMDLIRDISDFLRDRKEGVEESGYIPYYE